MARMAWSGPLRRRPLASGIGLVLLLVALGIGLSEWRGWPFLREPLQRTLSERLDREVRIGSNFRLHLLGSMRLRTDLLELGPPRWAPQGPGERFFHARDVYLVLPWGGLWNTVVRKRPQPLRVSTLDVGSFEATLWRRADGRANWEFGSPGARPQQPPMRPEFAQLRVRNGRLTLDDAPTDLSLRAEAQTREGLAAGEGAGLHIQGEGRYRKGEFSFTVRSNGVLPLIAPEGASVSVPITLQGRTPEGKVRFEGQARDIIHLQALSGSFQVSGSSLARVGEPFGITLPTTAPFEAAGRLGKSGEVWKAEFARFEVGSSRLAGDFTFDRRPELPMLSGVLRGKRLDLKDLGPAFGAPTGGAPNPPPPAGKLFPDREFDIPSLRQMNADVRVDLRLADLHTALLEPLAPLQGRIVLRDGVLRIEDLLARTSGGEIKGLLALDGRSERRPMWRGDLRVSGVRLEQWLNLRNRQAKPARSAAAGKEPATRYVSGRLGGHFRFTGTGRSVADMVASLDGSLAAWVNDGEVSHLALEAAGLDIAQALGVMLRGDDALPMECAVTQLTARDGLLRTDVALVDTSDTTLVVQGEVSLSQERMALTARAYPKDFSPAALRAPVHVEGSFRQPRVRLEKKPIAMKAAAAVALGTITPLAALLPLIDPGKQAPLGCQQALAHLRGVRGVEPPKVQAAGTEHSLKRKPADGP